MGIKATTRRVYWSERRNRTYVHLRSAIKAEAKAIIKERYHSDTHAEICGDSAAGSAAQFLMQLQTRTQRGNASAKPCLNKEMYGNQD